MLGEEHASPGLAEGPVAVFDAEMGEQVLKLGDKEVRRPEGGVAHFLGQMRRFAAADLVVADCGDAVRGGEIGDWDEVVAWNAGAAVQEDEGTGAGSGDEIAIDLVPGFTWFFYSGNVEVCFAFGDGMRRHDICVDGAGDLILRCV